MEITMVLTELGKKWHDEIRKVVKEAVEEAGVDVQVQETVIRADEEAIDAKCIGSPTIRVDGFTGGRLPPKSQIRSIRLPRMDMFAAQNHGGMSGMMEMREVEEIAVPAGSTVELEPGGFHVMLLDVQRELTPGETIELTLTFEVAGEMTVQAEVREP